MVRNVPSRLTDGATPTTSATAKGPAVCSPVLTCRFSHEQQPRDNARSAINRQPTTRAPQLNSHHFRNFSALWHHHDPRVRDGEPLTVRLDVVADRRVGRDLHALVDDRAADL